mgnify:CR=1 FL=1
MTTAGIGGIAVLCLILLSLAHSTWRLKIAPMPSSPHARARIIELVTAQLSAAPSNEPTVFELGSGWGGLAAAIASEIATTTRVRGYERSLVPYMVSRSLRQRPPALTFHRDDITTAIEKVRSGDVLLCYLCPEQMQRVSDALRARLAREPLSVTLISLTFALPDFSPAETHTLATLYRDRLYRYAISDAAPLA